MMSPMFSRLPMTEIRPISFRLRSGPIKSRPRRARKSLISRSRKSPWSSRRSTSSSSSWWLLAKTTGTSRSMPCTTSAMRSASRVAWPSARDGWSRERSSTYRVRNGLSPCWSSGTSVSIARAASRVNGRKTKLIPKLKSVWAFAIWRAGSAAVLATTAVNGPMNGKTRAAPSTLKAMWATATRLASAVAPTDAVSAVAHVPMLAPSTMATAPPSDEHRCEAEPDQERRVVGDAERDQLNGEGGADVGAENQPERLPESHEARGDEPDQHQRRGRRGLDEGSDRRAREHGHEPSARQPREEVAQPAAEGALERLAAEPDPVEQERHAPEQGYQDCHGALSVSGAGGSPGVSPSTTLAITGSVGVLSAVVRSTLTT